MASNSITSLFMPIVFYSFHSESSEYVPLGIIVRVHVLHDNFNQAYGKVGKLKTKIITKNFFKALDLIGGIDSHLRNYA